MTHADPLFGEHEPRTTSARADDVRTHERAQYATPPYLPTVPTYRKDSDSPTIHPSSTSTRGERSDMDGRIQIQLACPLCRRLDGHEPTCLHVLADALGASS